MRCGLNFFPSCHPEYKSGEVYFQEALDLCALADGLGYATVKIVEHYFRAYGGYSPSPLIFLAAAAQRTRHIRLVTGAVIPAFHHPLRLAAELAMVDCISGGRLEAGFARAFLPHEFEAFEVDMEESRPRFEEGIAIVKRLWTENVTSRAAFIASKTSRSCRVRSRNLIRRCWWRRFLRLSRLSGPVNRHMA